MPTKESNIVKRTLDLKKPPQLSAEQKGLDIARRELEEQQLARYGNASGGGDRLQSSREKVQLHERNIEALRREIGNLR